MSASNHVYGAAYLVCVALSIYGKFSCAGSLSYLVHFADVIYVGGWSMPIVDTPYAYIGYWAMMAARLIACPGPLPVECFLEILVDYCAFWFLVIGIQHELSTVVLQRRFTADDPAFANTVVILLAECAVLLACFPEYTYMIAPIIWGCAIIFSSRRGVATIFVATICVCIGVSVAMYDFSYPYAVYSTIILRLIVSMAPIVHTPLNACEEAP